MIHGTEKSIKDLGDKVEADEKAAAEAAAEAAEAEAALAAAEAEEAMEEKIDSSATAQMESALRAKTGAVSKIEEEE